MDYRAKCKSYGFRGKFWEVDEVATGVNSSENIPLAHFEAISKGEVKEDAKPEAVKPKHTHKPKVKGGA